jgi:DNA topoisomerase I
LPGHDLFQYLDESGKPQKISSGDVNAYLRGIAGEEFSAKDYRTWAGTVLAAIFLRELARSSSNTAPGKNVVQAIERVAGRLGNTPAICRKCYIHPAVLDAYLNGETIEVRASGARMAPSRNPSKLSADESALLAFLRRRQDEPKASTLDLLKKSLASRLPRAATRTRQQRSRPHGSRAQR